VDGEQSSNVMSGSTEILVQAGRIEGGVHYHIPAAILRTPSELPNPIEHLVNQERVLRALATGVTGRQELDRPLVKLLRGAQGSGKTTVALFWLASCRTHCPHGQLYTNLGAFVDEQVAVTEVLAEFLVALGINRSEVPADAQTRAKWFRTITTDRSVAIFLDDVRTPAQVRELLPGPGGSIVVVTGLGFGFETLRDVAELIDIDPVGHDMAVTMLEMLAGTRIHDEPQARDAIIQRCSGRAQAVRIVGAVLAEQPMLTMSELLEELTDPEGGLLRLAVGGERDLATVLDTGYRRLSSPAQACYRALGLHPATEAVSVHVLAAALDVSAARLRPAIRELLGMHLAEQPAAGRLAVHSLNHEHARLLAGDSAPERDRIIAWYLRGAVTADAALMPTRPWRARLFPSLRVDPEHPAVSEPARWLRTERANLRATVTSGYRLGDLDTVMRLCLVLWSLYEPGKFADDLLATQRAWRQGGLAPRREPGPIGAAEPNGIRTQLAARPGGGGSRERHGARSRGRGYRGRGHRARSRRQGRAGRGQPRTGPVAVAGQPRARAADQRSAADRGRPDAAVGRRAGRCRRAAA
jgi:hypothetical protein